MPDPHLDFHDSKERPANGREIPEEKRDPGPRNMSPQGDAVRTLGREAERPSDSSTSPNRPSHSLPLSRFTNYRSRYGYTRRWAVIAEVWWRLEHSRFERVRLFAYPRRKAAERKGAA